MGLYGGGGGGGGGAGFSRPSMMGRQGWASHYWTNAAGNPVNGEGVDYYTGGYDINYNNTPTLTATLHHHIAGGFTDGGLRVYPWWSGYGGSVSEIIWHAQTIGTCSDMKWKIGFWDTKDDPYDMYPGALVWGSTEQVDATPTAENKVITGIADGACTLAASKWYWIGLWHRFVTGDILARGTEPGSKWSPGIVDRSATSAAPDDMAQWNFIEIDEDYISAASMATLDPMPEIGDSVDGAAATTFASGNHVLFGVQHHEDRTFT